MKSFWLAKNICCAVDSRKILQNLSFTEYISIGMKVNNLLEKLKEALIVSHHPNKTGGHRHWGSGDIKTPANTVILRDIRDCICPLTSVIVIFYKVDDMSCAAHVSNKNLMNNLYGNFFFSVSNEISPILVTRFLGKNDKTSLKKILAACPKNWTRRKKTKMAIAKLF